MVTFSEPPMSFFVKQPLDKTYIKMFGSWVPFYFRQPTSGQPYHGPKKCVGTREVRRTCCDCMRCSKVLIQLAPQRFIAELKVTASGSTWGAKGGLLGIPNGPDQNRAGFQSRQTGTQNVDVMFGRAKILELRFWRRTNKNLNDLCK